MSLNAMNILISLGILYGILTQCYGTKCFECQNVQYPRDCLKLTDCNSDEVCFTEQVVTPSRNVVFNSGCLPKSQCPPVSIPLIGKRSADIVTKRATDILTCKECCDGDFCNKDGCGTQEIPLDQRGPYCYTCDIQNPKDCNNMTVCYKNELCMLYQPFEVGIHHGTKYRGQCQTQAVCAALTLEFGSQSCNPVCCSKDFCNDRCGSPTTITMTTSNPRTSNAKTTKAAMTTISSTKSYCDIENYTYLPNSHAQICIHIVNNHTPVSWDDARALCQAKREDLVVLDTHEKASLVQRFIRNDTLYNSDMYWIGAKDFNNDDHFSWTDGQQLRDEETPWAKGHPVHVLHGKDEDCIGMFRHHHRHYNWRDFNCNTEGSFICERTRT